MSAQSFKKTILLVEDDEDDVWLIKKGLEPFLAQYDVHVAPDGAEALAYLRGTDRYADRAAHPFPSMVLLDIRLPKVSGLDVLRWIRAQPSLGGLIVIMLTGSESPRDLQVAYDLQANSFLRKSPLLTSPEAARSVFGYWIRHNEHPQSKPVEGDSCLG
jgi:CheY-like chemotaxis protein